MQLCLTGMIEGNKIIHKLFQVIGEFCGCQRMPQKVSKYYTQPHACTRFHIGGGGLEFPPPPPPPPPPQQQQLSPPGFLENSIYEKGISRGTEWHKFQLHSTFHCGVKGPQKISLISVKAPYYTLKLVTWPTTNQSSGIGSPDRYFKQRNAHFSIYCALKCAISSPELFVGHVQL